MLSKFYQKIRLYIKRLFKKNDNIKIGACYGVLHGHYVGELFVFVEQKDNVLRFLSIPSMKNREVPEEKYQYGIKNGVIEFVEMLPRNERKVCRAQFYSNLNE